MTTLTFVNLAAELIGAFFFILLNSGIFLYLRFKKLQRLNQMNFTLDLHWGARWHAIFAVLFLVFALSRGMHLIYPSNSQQKDFQIQQQLDIELSHPRLHRQNIC